MPKDAKPVNEGFVEDKLDLGRRALRAVRSKASDALAFVQSLGKDEVQAPTNARTYQAVGAAVLVGATWWLLRKALARRANPVDTEAIVLKVPDLEVHFCTTGASITKILTPDSNGKMEDIVLGHPTPGDYAVDLPGSYFGCVVGRVANRVDGGRFRIGPSPIEHVLEQNDGAHALHGGSHHWGRQEWVPTQSVVDGCPTICFARTSPNKEAGYPGTVHATVTYTLRRQQGHSDLSVSMEAVTSHATPINMVHHTYWNLAGEAAIAKGEDISDHTVKLVATHMTPVSKDLIPTGAIVPVQGTVFDLSQGAHLAHKLAQLPGGFDHNWVTVPPVGTSAKWDRALCSQPGGLVSDQLHRVAEVSHVASGRTLQVETNAPGLQFYTGNFLGETPGKAKAVYNKYAGLCLESQTFPNGVNQENFPSPVLLPQQKYEHKMRFSFNKRS